MARVSVATQQIVQTGLAPVLTAPTADGDVIDVGRVALMVTNGGAATTTVTVPTPVTVDGLQVEDLVVPVAAGATVLIGPLPSRVFAQPFGSPDAGRAHVDYGSGFADLDRGVVTL